SSSAWAQSAANQQSATTKAINMILRIGLLLVVKAVVVNGHAIAVHIRGQIITERHGERLRRLWQQSMVRVCVRNPDHLAAIVIKRGQNVRNVYDLSALVD